MRIWFDMDGTLADLYGVDNWLARLRLHDVSPYEEAKPLLSMRVLAEWLKKAQQNGHTVGIISWTSNDDNEDYHRLVQWAKYHWLRSHLHSVSFDDIIFTKYGEDKAKATGGGILFDDNADVREAWNDSDNRAYTPEEIISVLKNLCKKEK